MIARAHSAYSKWTHDEIAKTSLTGRINEDIKQSAIYKGLPYVYVAKGQSDLLMNETDNSNSLFDAV